MSSTPVKRWPALLAALLVLALYGPSLARHAIRAANPNAFTADATQHIVPYLRYGGAEVQGADYLGDYFRACHPIGYRTLYTAWGQVADPRVLSKLLPFILLAATLSALALAASRWGGAAAGASVLLLALSTPLILGRLAGGLPRSFAFPLLAGMLAAVVHGRARWLAGLTTAAAATYPAAAVPGGLALAVITLLLPAGDRGEADAWSAFRRWRLVGLTGLAVVALSLPTLIAVRAFGPQIRAQELTSFPEAGPGGRLHPEDSITYARPIPDWLATALPSTFRVRGEAWFPAAVRWIGERPGAKGASPRADIFFATLGYLCLAGLFIGCLRDAAMRRVLALIGSVLVGYLLARAASPNLFLPQRHMAYPTTLFAVALPVLASGALWPRRAGLAALLTAGSLLLFTGARVLERNGFEPGYIGERSWIPAIASLAPSSLIAGWPNLLDPVPYLAGRRVLINRETALPYHHAATLEIRRRMEATLAACFATNTAPLLTLRDTFHVTHLVIYLPHYEKPPRTYHPFQSSVARLTHQRQPGDYEVLRQLDTACYRDEKTAILDLSRLANP